MKATPRLNAKEYAKLKHIKEEKQKRNKCDVCGKDTKGLFSICSECMKEVCLCLWLKLCLWLHMYFQRYFK